MSYQNEKIAFRPMEVSDLSSILDVEVNSFSAPWPKQAFYNELVRNQFAHYTVVTINDKVIGYCGLWIILDEAHITNIAIHPNYRGKGLGEATLMYVMETAKMLGANKMTLEVRVSNHIAQSLYKKMGFVPSGIRPKYYSDNQEDALIMWVTFNEKKAKSSTRD
ncbi:ribosomal protein S18-alanine N-acetyltransferase [Thermoflavimicrobium daqui]|uniref:Ribosomal-protein-alanine N-acetyltransferase n=1 Tax=Thermoflavimicrobium daqui TaxID=2137476 RepID=A0A364K1X9_9BACL|nr:ribosomal protein S18-alanine N-acetyltransferase [Thermoflavimicrobium daqui]RAL22031.1 ribosomal-protein-alanine N-acetyltransferase [Thermoflavimicrobium daqui]